MVDQGSRQMARVVGAPTPPSPRRRVGPVHRAAALRGPSTALPAEALEPLEPLEPLADADAALRAVEERLRRAAQDL